MKPIVGIKTRKVLIVILCLIYVCFIVGTVGGVIVKEYQNHYTEEKYQTVDTKCSFVDLFYDSFATEVYGIGMSSKSFLKERSENADLIEEGVKLYTEEQINEYISLYKSMSFQPIKRNEAFIIALKCTQKRSLTSIRLDETPIVLSDVIDNPLYSQKIYEAMIDEGFGVYEAGIFQVGDKYYMIADLVTHNSWPEMQGREYPAFFDLSRTVFEIEPSKAIEELSKRRGEFQVPYLGFESISIPWNAFLWESVLFVLMLFLLIILKRQKAS